MRNNCKEIYNKEEITPSFSVSRKITFLFSVITPFFVTFFLLLWLEVCLRLFNAVPLETVGWRTSGNEAPSEQINQLGFRGQTIKYDKKDYVIVLLGDSQVLASACPFDKMPEKALQNYISQTYKLPVKVFSVGAGGWGQDQELIGLRDYFSRFRADLIVVWLTPSNDIWNNIFPTHYPKDGMPKPTYWLSDGNLHGPNYEMDEPLTSGIRFLDLVRLKLRWQRPSMDDAWEKKFLPPPYKPLEGYKGPIVEDLDKVWDVAKLRDENFRNEKCHRSTFFTPPSPRILYGISLTNKLLRVIEYEAKSHYAQFVIFTIQSVDLRTDPEPPIRDGVYRFKSEYYRLSVDQHLTNIAAMTDGLEYILIQNDVENWQAAPNDRHFNWRAVDAGMQKLSVKLKKYITDNALSY